MAALVGLLLLTPVVLAQEEYSNYVPPKTQQAEDVKTLFDIIFWIAMVVFVFVEALLFYTIWRFRHNKNVPKGETHRGHTKAEIIWSIIPALVFLLIGVLSVQTMQAIETVPDEANDLPITVEASQFAWTFKYPDADTPDSINELHVESGRTFRLDITSVDVIHAVWIAEFAIKLDAVPGRTNQIAMYAPEPGEYFLQCAEYCGVGHHAMHAKVIVFPAGARDKAYGAPPEVDPLDRYKDIAKDVEQDMELLERGGPGGNEPWSIEPPTLTVKQGQGVWLTAINPEGQGVHNLTVPAFRETTPPRSGGNADVLAFIADKTGEFEYFCGIPGHKELGMKGKLIVQA